MMSMRARSIWIVVLADVVLTYAYVFIAHTWLASMEFRVAPLRYWLTQWWVYSVIAPVAVVASCLGARQVLDAWAGRPRWWRQPLEGMAIGAACVVPFVLSTGTWSDFLLLLRDTILLCAGLALLLTCVNVPLARLLRPDAASDDDGAPHAPSLTPGTG